MNILFSMSVERLQVTHGNDRKVGRYLVSVLFALVADGVCGYEVLDTGFINDRFRKPLSGLE